MDVLSEVLRAVQLDGAIFFNAEFSEPWRFHSPETCHLGPMLAPGSENIIIYHLLVHGSAYAQMENGVRVPLGPGDIVTFPRGDAHFLGGGEGAGVIDGRSELPALLAQGLELVRAGGGGPTCRFICGFLACDRQLSQTVLGSLPPLLKVNIRDDPSGQWLENSLRFSVSEAVASRAGSAAMLARLSEVVFVETLRRYIAGLPDSETGWLTGARDPDVGRALALLHQRPAARWTIAKLASEVGLSRSVLAERFRHFLGEPPMTYLSRWRLRMGAQRLAATSHSVAEIAAVVGYESEASFNRAFKREFSVPPARYRREAKARRGPSATRHAGGQPPGGRPSVALERIPER
jgi:AraC-like DNA-binding protein